MGQRWDASSRRSTRRRRTAWVWDWRSVARSSKCTAADCGRSRIRDRVRRSRSASPRPLRLCPMVTETDPTVFVVDDDPSMHRSTERLVRSAGFAVKTFGSAAEFIESPQPEGPACLVLDVRMPGQSGLDLQADLTGSGIEIPIIFVTGHASIPMTVRAMKAGAVEFLTKPYRRNELLQAVRTAIERDRGARKERLEVMELRQRYEQLTPRERGVMALVVRGMLNKQIAGELTTAERTIKFHRAHIMHKMKADSVAELVRMAGQLGLATA